MVIPCVPKDLTVILVFSCQAYTYAESLQCVITKICSRIKIAISACITIASMFTQNSNQKRKKISQNLIFLWSMVTASPTCVAGIYCLDPVPKVWTAAFTPSLHVSYAC
jgi:hypothetical protein